MIKKCITCKYWTSNFVKKFLGENFCENEKLRNKISIWETELPDWIHPKILSCFECDENFGCQLWKDSGLMWGRTKEELEQ